MPGIYKSIDELIGSTPLLEVRNIEKKHKSLSRLLVKLEMFNPAGSAKDRVALAMLEDAEAKGLIEKGSVVIEPTSGNTGIGLAAVGAARGYRVIIVMPDSMSEERQRLMKAYGAELVLTDGTLGMKGAIEKAEQLKSEIPGSIIAGQFSNPANPAAHRVSTGPEIWRDTAGKVDILVAGVGTGGTLSGTAEYLRIRNPELRVVAVEPAGSPLISEGRTGKHDLQGIGANFIPENLNTELIDEVITVSDEDAYAMGRELARSEGILCGISSGAALHAAVTLTARRENAGKTIVTILPDTGERYLSSAMFEV
ncbi:MAG: cysteine synthase A [Oscillospiraceae bacterium]|nr:cysteine synthase A [Oscillospiraceae bacterium]